MAVIDIFNPQVTAIAKGLEGKTFFIYGSNSVGKTSQTVKASKPFVIATESGLNATAGVRYERVNTWSDFKKIVQQFTNKATVEKAREMYDTIIIDEVYASSILCQNYVLAVYGNGALTLGDGTGKTNLYQIYEKIFFDTVNSLLSANFTVIFIGHEQKKEGDKVRPYGDKRCINPIVNFVDYVIYVKSNGVDADGKLIPSSAYLAETDEYFARTRFDTTPTFIKEFTMDNLVEAINIGVEGKARDTGTRLITYDEQKAKNTTTEIDFDTLMTALDEVAYKFVETNRSEILTEVTEKVLGTGHKVHECNKNQIEALQIIFDELTLRL